MKVLFILPYDIIPANAGNKTLTYNLLKYLTKNIECEIIILIDNTINSNILLEKYRSSFPELKNLFIYNKPNSLRKFLFKVKYLIKGLHPSLGNFFNSNLKKFLIKIDNTNEYDLIHFDMIHMAIYKQYIKQTPTLIVASDAYSNASLIAMSFNKNPFLRLRDYFNTLTLLRIEKLLYPKFNRVCVVSDIDKEYLRKNSINSNFEQIGIGVSDEFFQAKYYKKDFKGILVLGSLNHKIISENIVCFLNEIKKANEKFKIPITILGKNPSTEILKCIHENDLISHIEFVDDFLSFLNNDWVCVYPQKCGSGLQTKVQQAMAIGLPVLGYSISFGGLNIINENNCIIIKNNLELCQRSVELALNEKIRISIGINAASYIKNKFSISKTGVEMLNIYNSVL
jgi:glycosyltransferase involved in cell wall biosynthesis